jgi:carboxypeptidase C (cathepsin A)
MMRVRPSQRGYLSAIALMLCLGMSLPAAVLAQTPPTASEAFTPAAFGAPVVTRHKGTFGGQKIDYTATVAATVLKDKTGADTLSVVTYAYEARTKDTSKRPVMFIFNGGPISPSAYLHMGAFGPRRLAVPDDLSADPKTFVTVDNPNSPLDAADLVFIDPAGTGLSRPLGTTDLKVWFTAEADGEEFAQVITQWMHGHGREASPVYVFGESYGTIRAPIIMKKLAEAEKPLTLGGVVLFGQAANIVEYVQRSGNILSHTLSLPTLAATAWYHQAVDRKGLSLEAFVTEATAFADKDYLLALYEGGGLDPARRDEIAAQLSGYTGIPKDYLIAHDLKITKETYRRTLFKDKNLILGMADTRYTGPLKPGADPSATVPAAMAAAFQTYLKDDLKVTTPLTYLVDSPVRGGWDYGFGGSPFSDYPFAAMISTALARQPNMKVMVGVGYYDTQTTLGASQYLIKQMNWPKANTRFAVYEGGHMSYSNEKALIKLSTDMRDFLKAGQ